MARSKGTASRGKFKVVDMAEIQITGDHDADAFALILIESGGYIQRSFKNFGDGFLSTLGRVVEADVVVAGLALVRCPVAEVAYQGQQNGVSETFPEMVIDMTIQPGFAQRSGAGRGQFHDDSSGRFQAVPGDKGAGLTLLDAPGLIAGELGAGVDQLDLAVGAHDIVGGQAGEQPRLGADQLSLQGAV